MGLTISAEYKNAPFPLKLVSSSYRGTYESCNARSYIDPRQGASKLTKAGLKKIREENQKEMETMMHAHL